MAKTEANRVRIGLYMFTPIMGGAEMYFRNLLWRIDREKYEVTLFVEPWDVFEKFLDVEHCPDIRICRIPVLEPGGHYTEREGAGEGTGPVSLKGRIRRFVNRPGGISRLAKMTLWVGRRYLSLLPNFVRMLEAFREHPVDLLHIVNGGYPGPVSAQLAPIAANLAGIPVSVMSICNTPFPIAFPKILERLLDKCVGATLSCTLAPTRNLGEAILERTGFTERQLAIVPYGVLDPGVTYGIFPAAGEGARKISMTASFLPHKGHKYLLQIFQVLRQKYPDITLTLVGDGPELTNVEALTKEMGLNPWVTFPGRLPLEATLRVIAESEIVVHPSELEGVPYVILHSMSLGRPVLATRVGGIEQTILHGKTGLLVAPTDTAALQASLDSLLADREYCRELGRNARARYDEIFTLDAMVRNHERLYEERRVRE